MEKSSWKVTMASLLLESQPVPLRQDERGAIRVGNTRVLLELVIEAYLDGATPETIVKWIAFSYPRSAWECTPGRSASRGPKEAGRTGTRLISVAKYSEMRCVPFPVFPVRSTSR